MKFKLTLAKRIVIIILVAIITSIPVAFLMDSIFHDIVSVYAATIGFVIVSIGVSYFLINDKKIKSKSLTFRMSMFAISTVGYVILAWVVFFTFLVFSISAMQQGT